jgi:hypothetical protein
MKGVSLCFEWSQLLAALLNVVKQAVMLTPMTAVPPDCIILTQRAHVFSEEDQSHWSCQSEMNS